MFVVFADMWQSYKYAYYTKTALKEMFIQRTQTNF